MASSRPDGRGPEQFRPMCECSSQGHVIQHFSMLGRVTAILPRFDMTALHAMPCSHRYKGSEPGARIVLLRNRRHEGYGGRVSPPPKSVHLTADSTSLSFDTSLNDQTSISKCPCRVRIPTMCLPGGRSPCRFGPRQSDVKFGFSEQGRLLCEVRCTVFAGASSNKQEQVRASTCYTVQAW